MRRALLAAVVFAFAHLALAADTPDLIIHHAKVFTADPAHRWAEAVAIRDNRIVAVGTNAEVTALADDKTKRIDAGGRVVIPGFNDAHTHHGPRPEGFILSLDHDPTWALVYAGIVNGTEETPGDFWIFGTIGPKALADPAVNAQALDKASGNRKVVLQSWTGHGEILSSEAMNSLRVRESTDDPAGGWYERDASHHLTGKLFEYAGWDVERRMADSVSDADAIDQLKAYSDQALALGITSIQNMSMQSLSRYEKVERHGPAAIRIRIIRIPVSESASRGDDRDGTDLPALSNERPLSIINGTKWILDGTPVEQGAAVRTPYPGGGDHMGKLDFPPDELKVIMKEAFDSKEQTLLHVAGDRTAAAVFDAMRTVGPPEEWRKKRLRIEHGDGLHPDLIALAKEFGVIVVLNPAHIVARPLYPAGPYMPARSLIKAGIPIAIGSDGAMNPGLNLQLITTMPGNAAEAITREEAVDAYTRGSAYAEMMENDKGTIAPGKLADLAILSQDIFKVPADELPATTSVLTIVDGRIAYDAGAVEHNEKKSKR
ncbi:MAG TPA: amidohydrolase family protein [Thermoanaerobaculia bacterium]|jgi:predicted amidohydrolase YtcJ|nr:amidohydrolase family protein [Thermoanaerobaculia bacterium]